MSVQVKSHLRDFGTLILCTSGLFGIIVLVFEWQVDIKQYICLYYAYVSV